MSTFQVPYSSSPTQPSTPDAASKRIGSSRSSLSALPPHPSTTPLGPPPSSVGSFTPAGPPPSTLLGSSQIDDDDIQHGSSNGSYPGAGFIKTNLPGRDASQMLSPGRSNRSDLTDLRGSPLNGKLAAASKKRSHTFEGSQDEASLDLDGDYDDDDFAFPSLYGSGSSRAFKSFQGKTSIAGSRQKLSPATSLNDTFSGQHFSSPRGAKRSRAGEVISDSRPRSVMRWDQHGNSIISSIAQNFTTSMDPAILIEPHDFIVDLEKCLQKLSPVVDGDPPHQQDLQRDVDNASQLACALFDQWIPDRSAAQDPVESFRIGPDDGTPALQKAAWLSILLLRTHCSSSDDIDRFLSSDIRRTTQQHNLSRSASIPRTLLDWLNQCHNPWVSMAAEVNLHKPSPPAHYNFWDIILILVLRGRLESAIFLLQRSDFHHAESASKDGQVDGYTDTQAENIKGKVKRVVEVMNNCPGIQGDWHVDSNPWALFRKDARTSLAELDSLAENGRGGSRNHRQSGSSIPWTVYQSLKVLHGILLGNDTEILASAQDWVEATIGLAVWRKEGSSAKMTTSTFTNGTQSLSRSILAAHPSAMISGDELYLHRLSWSLGRATDDSKGDGFQINTNRAIEVGLACIFEGDYGNVLGILHGWSLPVTDAVIELATAGGWYSPDVTVSGAVMQNFDDEDLMVLSNYGQPENNSLQRDTIMVEYASALFKRGEQQDGVDGSHSEWQLAISIMMRIGNRAACSEQIDEILSRIKIDSDATMDLILDICRRCNMEGKGYSLAEKHADLILENTEDYGKALKYYARSHAARKIRNVLDLLISMSLIRSKAFPAQDSLDEDFKSFLDNTGFAYEHLFSSDKESAVILHESMAGYATLRKFYDLRDGSYKSNNRMDHSRRALLAVISSAADNIDGGILDEQRSALIRFEGLLVLLGEALVFFNDLPNELDISQSLAITSAMENLQALPKQDVQQCEDFLQSTLAYYNGHTRAPSPSKLLQTMSSMTSGSSFSLVSSSLLESMSEDSIDKPRAEETREETQRAWDWRTGMRKDATGESILRILRLKVAQRLATFWIEGGSKR